MNWMDGAKEDLVDMFIVYTVEEIQVKYCDAPVSHLSMVRFVPIYSVNIILVV